MYKQCVYQFSLSFAFLVLYFLGLNNIFFRTLVEYHLETSCHIGSLCHVPVRFYFLSFLPFLSRFHFRDHIFKLNFICCCISLKSTTFMIYTRKIIDTRVLLMYCCNTVFNFVAITTVMMDMKTQ